MKDATAAAAPAPASGEGEEGAAGRAGIAASSPQPMQHHHQPKEEEMPNGNRKPCPECGSTAKHKNGCSKPPKEEAPPAKARRGKRARSAAPRAAARVLKEGPRGDDGGFDLGAASVDDLVALIAGCQEELRQRREQIAQELQARKDQVAEQLAAIEKAIGSAAA